MKFSSVLVFFYCFCKFGAVRAILYKCVQNLYIEIHSKKNYLISKQIKNVFPRVYDFVERHRLYRLGFLLKILRRSSSLSHKL